MSDQSIMEFDNSDLLRNVIVEPAWYRVRVLGVSGPEVSKKGDSYNYLARGIIICNADNGSEDYKDVPTFWNFNSKVRSFALSFLEAIGQPQESVGRVDLNAASGEEFEQFIGNRTWEERLQNDPQHKYRMVREKRGV